MILQITDPYFAEKSKAITALQSVIDPELYINIIDLGLVYDLDFSQSEEILITMTLSTPHCPLQEAITNGVNNALSPLFPDHKINIDLVWEPVWDISMMTESARNELGL